MSEMISKTTSMMDVFLGMALLANVITKIKDPRMVESRVTKDSPYCYTIYNTQFDNINNDVWRKLRFSRIWKHVARDVYFAVRHRKRWPTSTYGAPGASQRWRWPGCPPHLHGLQNSSFSLCE